MDRDKFEKREKFFQYHFLDFSDWQYSGERIKKFDLTMDPRLEVGLIGWDLAGGSQTFIY